MDSNKHFYRFGALGSPDTICVINGRQVLKMDNDAEELWAKFYETFGDGPEWNRIDTYGFRLMAVQAVLRGEKTVTKENVQQVIEFLQYEVGIACQ